MSLTWTQRSGGYPSGNNAFTIAADTSGNAVVIPATTIYRSTDGGITWTQRSDPSGVVSKCVAWGNGVFMAGCTGANFIGVRSTDGGSTWSTMAKPTGWINHGTDALIYHPGLNKWMAIQNDTTASAIRYSVSSDGGVTWGASATISGTEQTTSSGGTVMAVDATNFIVTGRDSANSNWIVAYTSDTSNWTLVTGGSIFSNPGERNAISYAGGVYLTCGHNNMFVVESDTLAGFASNAGYSMTTVLGGSLLWHVFTPDNGTTWFCSSGTSNSGVASTSKKPNAVGVWTAETIALPAGSYITCFCYDVVHSTIIGICVGTTNAIFTAPFVLPSSTQGGGGGHGSKGGQNERDEQRRQHPRPSFGFYADQLRRQQLAKPDAQRKLNWVRHYDD